MKKITMDEDGASRTNYGVCSLLVLMASGGSAWVGLQLAFAQMASIVSSAFTHRTTSDGNYGMVGVALLVVSVLTLIWAIALAGAGFAVNRGRIFSLLTILIILSPVIYILLQFFVALLAPGPTSIFG